MNYLLCIPLSFPLTLHPLNPFPKLCVRKPFAIAPALHPSVISAKESVPVSCEVPVTCSKPPTSEEWTLVTSKRHPRLAVKCNSMLHVACTIRQSCPSSESQESSIFF
ncbi:hypothetical protein JTE90_023601 [Oedothorax gibbosus]|uniref:Uncharacterized protein n=1 Tax=Oedothorax gibbosus TaxID=931172 RepID=A0AAV6UDE2_9ARAC|nr:hypothetical protein JTE90_023601 [Oedothorax gibbosus]